MNKDELSLEQEFTVNKFYKSVENLPREKLLELIKFMFVDHMVKENYYKKLLAHKWEIK